MNADKDTKQLMADLGQWFEKRGINPEVSIVAMATTIVGLIHYLNDTPAARQKHKDMVAGLIKKSTWEGKR